jgi:hypothetical protein
MSLFSKKVEEELALIFDIGSGSVGGALAVVSKNHTPKLLYTVRLPIIWQEKPEAGHFLSSVVRAVHSVSQNIERNGLQHLRFTKFSARHIKNVYAVFSSPWYISQTKILTIEKKAPTLVTKALIDDVIKQEEKAFTEALDHGTHSHIFEHAEVIERGIIRTRLNGYDTVDPYNKKASNIETTFFMSFVSKDILEAVRKSVHNHFNYRHIYAYSFPLVAFKAISSANKGLDDFLLVDVRGEVTDVSLIKDGALLESISFPLGKGALLRAVSEATNSTVHIALSFIDMVTYNKSTPELSTTLTPVLEDFRKKWYKGFKDAIDEITRDVAVPKRIFLVSDNEVEVFFEKSFGDITNGYEVHPLKRHELHNYIEMNSKFDDPFLALEAIYINNIIEH